MTTPPNQPGKRRDMPLEKQLDALLVEIEEAEPGVIDPGVLPSDYQPKAAAQAAEQAPSTPAPAPPAAASPAEPSASETTPEQADMLAALNTALQGIAGDPPAEEAGEPEAAATQELSMEEKLQQEIAALMNGEPQAESKAEASPAAATASAVAEPSTEDQIAMEIESLLNAEQAAAEEQTEASPESSIDELDKMLASEIDADDDLAGDFQTVEDATAGIQVAVPTGPSVDDEHAATARDVAAELDSQPEDLPRAKPEPVAATEKPNEDPFAVLAEIAETAEVSEEEYQQQVARQQIDYRGWLDKAKDRLFSTCYLVNYPARRLSAEWRANLGYIALLNLFFGVGLWIVLILF